MTDKIKMSADGRLENAASRLCDADRLKSTADILTYLKSVSEEAFKKGVSLACGEKIPGKRDVYARD